SISPTRSEDSGEFSWRAVTRRSKAPVRVEPLRGRLQPALGADDVRSSWLEATPLGDTGSSHQGAMSPEGSIIGEEISATGDRAKFFDAPEPSIGSLAVGESSFPRLRGLQQPDRVKVSPSSPLRFTILCATSVLIHALSSDPGGVL